MICRGFVAALLLAPAGLSFASVSKAAGVSSAAALSLIASVPPEAPTVSLHFTISDLGTLGGISSSAQSVNDGSQVVGSSFTRSGAEHAFLYSEGKMTDLSTLGGTRSVGLEINSLGHVVGNSETAGQTAQHAFIFDGSRMLDLGTLGGASSSAAGINDADEVVGYSFVPVVSHSFVSGIVWQHAFLYSGGKMGDLGTLGGSNSAAAGINAIGQIVGDSFTGVNSAQHAFLYSGGKMGDLGTLGGANSTGIGINALGQTVGSAFVAGDGAFHAFLYSGGAILDLGTLGGANSAANGINASGQVVGDSDAASGERAFLWAGGIMTDLNSVIPASSGWELQSAASISDGGEIAGSGLHNGQMRAYLLTPEDGKPLSLEAVASAHAAIDAMIAQLSLPPNSPRATVLCINYLTNKLQAARRKLDQGNGLVVVNLLRSVVNFASVLTSSEMAAGQQESLIGSAQRIMAQLGY